MNIKILLGLFCVLPVMSANAAIPYRVQHTPVNNGKYDSESFAYAHRFYVGGAYDFSMWNSYTDNSDVSVDGKNTSAFDAVLGMRIYDTFRIEANYIRANAKYDAFRLTGDTAMLNAMFDARIDSLYRLFYRQHLVPYVGVGAGASWNKVSDVNIDNKVTPVMSVMAGLGLELGEYFTIDLGYRYMYMFSPHFDVVSKFNPTANQFRAGVRINF